MTELFVRDVNFTERFVRVGNLTEHFVREGNVKEFQSSREGCVFIISNSYTMVCPSVRGDNPRALASGLSPVQVDKPWCNHFIPPSSV